MRTGSTVDASRFGTPRMAGMPEYMGGSEIFFLRVTATFHKETCNCSWTFYSYSKGKLAFGCKIPSLKGYDSTQIVSA